MVAVVQDLRKPGTDWSIEIYCEPDGGDNPVNYQLLRPGLFDSWFDAMREAAANWDGSELTDTTGPHVFPEIGALTSVYAIHI